jgi:hypothetical protein
MYDLSFVRVYNFTFREEKRKGRIYGQLQEYMYVCLVNSDVQIVSFINKTSDAI